MKKAEIMLVYPRNKNSNTQCTYFYLLYPFQRASSYTK